MDLQDGNQCLVLKVILEIEVTVLSNATKMLVLLVLKAHARSCLDCLI